MSLTQANLSWENAITCFPSGFWGLTPAGVAKPSFLIEPFEVSCSWIVGHAEQPATLSIMLNGICCPIVGVVTVIIDVFLNWAMFWKQRLYFIQIQLFFLHSSDFVGAKCWGAVAHSQRASFYRETRPVKWSQRVILVISYGYMEMSHKTRWLKMKIK